MNDAIPHGSSEAEIATAIEVAQRGCRGRYGLRLQPGDVPRRLGVR